MNSKNNFLLEDILSPQTIEHIFDNSNSAIAILDSNMRYLYASEKWLEDYSIPLNKDDIISKNHYEIFKGEFSLKWLELHKKALKGQKLSSSNLESGFDTYIDSSAKVHYLTWDIFPWENKKNETGGIVILSNNLTPEKQQILRLEKKNKKLEYTLTHDPLTNLPNKNLFFKQVDQRINNTPLEEFTIIYFSITNLPVIHQFYGNHTTDNIIKKFASKLSDSIPSQIYRISGKRFSTIIPHKDKDKVSTIQELRKITKKLNHPLLIDNYHIDMKINSGCAFYPYDANNRESLDNAAYTALEQAKSTNKTTTCFNLKISQLENEKYNLEKLLKEKTIENNNFFIYYQPQINSKTNSVNGLEVLLRWKPQKNLISPKTFIPIAEQTGIIEQLGYYIIEQACNDIIELTHNNINSLKISINLSPYQFTDPKLASNILNILNEHKVDPSKIEFEITESVLDKENEYTISREIFNTINRLKKHNITFSIDDFGTQASNLYRVKDLPFSNLKIDKSFIRTICEDERTRAVVASIKTLAQGLGANIIAEGIENENQLYLLQGMGINIFQGYYYSKPQPLKNIRKQFLKNK